MPKIKFLTFPISLKGRNNFWLNLIGDPAVFSLESRIFHSISLCLIGLTAIYVPYNFYAGLYVGSVSALVICMIYLQQFYYSRFLGQAHSNMLFGLMGMVVFGINYFANSGIHGSTDLIWPVHLLMVFVISPHKQHIKWLLMYLLCFLVIHIVEYHFPNLVKYPIVAGKSQFIDRITAFPIPVLATYFIITYIMRNYDKERIAAEEKTLTLELHKEQILAQKEQLELSNVEKNKLMSIISHDLRTPLSNIQNYLQVLNEIEMEHSERMALERALLQSTNNTMAMLSNLLHWSKSQMEGPTVNLREVNLFNALFSTLEMEKMHASKKGISLNYHISPDLSVLADTDMLQLVMRNLISNAIKFTPSGGFIDIKEETINKECKISVSDNGEGIAKDKQDKIFSIKSEPSYGTNNEKGVGLGLVLCKEYIELQRGSIAFESEEGEGSSFFIFLTQ